MRRLQSSAAHRSSELEMMKAHRSRVLLGMSAVLSIPLIIVVLNGSTQHVSSREHKASPIKQLQRGEVQLSQSAAVEWPENYPKSLRKLNGYSDTADTEAASTTVDRGRCRLPENVVKNVKTFVLFTGYPRSGHSILGSMMNAHPHMAIAYNYVSVSKLNDICHQKGQTSNAKAKSKLFNSLFSHSCNVQYSIHENSSKKGYTLSIDYPWWGNYSEVLHVIGDRSAGLMTDLYISNETWFEQSYKQLMKVVDIPIKVIHVLRNPFDLISTSVIYAAGRREERHLNTSKNYFVLKLKSQAHNETIRTKYNNASALKQRIPFLFKMANAVRNMIALYGRENVLDVHNSDLVMQPKSTLKRICEFLQLKCPADYLKACEDKTFKHLSKTRELVEWPTRLRKLVENRIQEYPFFQRYSFDNDY